MEEIRVERVIEGKSYVFRTGLLAKQANGAVLVSIGDTEVLSTAVMSKEKPSTDFFPLTVQYNEKYYANGKIPGGYFKREGKLSDDEVFVCRMIDRPLRPLFPEGFFNEVQVIPTVVSIDGVHPSDVTGMIASSCALVVSDIPFSAPVGAVRVACVGGKFIANPTYDEMKTSTMDLIVAGTNKAITMIEGDCHEFSEDFVLEAISFAHGVIREIIVLQEELRKKAGKEKLKVELFIYDEALKKELRSHFYERLEKAIGSADKVKREADVKSIKDEALETYKEKDLAENLYGQIAQILHDFEKEIVRKEIIEHERRSDGRRLDELRPIDCRVDVLKNVHGSALFTRGQTQSLGIVTLGSLSDIFSNETVQGENRKRFFLHYNFPPFSVGEVGRLGAAGRREIGHGMLAERSLSVMFPSEEEFPFTVRAVSEILESNGSSSMASICSSSMAMMSAGIPLKKPVAGVAMGLIMEGEKYKVLTDIQGLEDHLGDMDFKVAGTADGITGFQLDIKIEGVTLEIMKKALYQAKDARLAILGKMSDAIKEARSSFNKTAPAIHTVNIPNEKIKVLIGPSGKNIKRIIEMTGSQVDISDSGEVRIFAKNEEAVKKTVVAIEEMIGMVKIGTIYNGTVKKITTFGAFVEVFNGTDGLLHISEIAEGRVNRVEDHLKEGQQVRVKVIGVDERGKISLSIKKLGDES